MMGNSLFTAFFPLSVGREIFSLGNGLGLSFHNNTCAASRCVSRFCRIFKIYTEQLINCFIRAEHLRKEFQIPKHLLPPSLALSNHSSSFPKFPTSHQFLVFLSIRSGMSQVCPAPVLDLNQCLYLPDIHTSAPPAPPPNVHTLPRRRNRVSSKLCLQTTLHG